MGFFFGSGGAINSRIEYNSELLVILRLQLFQLLSQFRVRLQYFPQPDERAHNGDIHRHRLFASIR